MEINVGETWMTKDGIRVVIEAGNTRDFPLIGRFEGAKDFRSFTAKGGYWISGKSNRDLSHRITTEIVQNPKFYSAGLIQEAFEELGWNNSAKEFFQKLRELDEPSEYAEYLRLKDKFGA